MRRRLSFAGKRPGRHGLVIEGTLPNLNDYVSRLCVGKFQGAGLKRETEARICLHIKRQMPGVKIAGPVVARFLWVEPNRKRDRDNVAFAKKFVFDALVASGVLQNDGWKQVAGFSDRFAVDPERPRVEVEIVPIKRAKDPTKAGQKAARAPAKEAKEAKEAKAAKNQITGAPRRH